MASSRNKKLSIDSDYGMLRKSQIVKKGKPLLNLSQFPPIVEQEKRRVVTRESITIKSSPQKMGMSF